jgi:hypothetical protein
MVPSKGLEPPHPCGYMDLNHARLPIPPRWQLQLCAVILAGRLAGRKEVQIHSTEAKQRVNVERTLLPCCFEADFSLRSILLVKEDKGKPNRSGQECPLYT